MTPLIEQVFQTEFKKQEGNITNLISDNHQLPEQEVNRLKSEINKPNKKTLNLHKTT